MDINAYARGLLRFADLCDGRGASTQQPFKSQVNICYETLRFGSHVCLIRVGKGSIQSQPWCGSLLQRAQLPLLCPPGEHSPRRPQAAAAVALTSTVRLQASSPYCIASGSPFGKSMQLTGAEHLVEQLEKKNPCHTEMRKPLAHSHQSQVSALN